MFGKPIGTEETRTGGSPQNFFIRLLLPAGRVGCSGMGGRLRGTALDVIRGFLPAQLCQGSQ